MKYSRDTEKDKNIPLNETCGNEINANDSVSAVAFFSLRDRLSSVVQHVRRAATDRKVSIACVHNLRVTTRRALAAIKLFRELLPAKPSVSLRRVLKVLLRTAGRTRDLDVLARRYRKTKNDNALHLVKELRNLLHCGKISIFGSPRKSRRCGRDFGILTTNVEKLIEHPKAGRDCNAGE